jgi:hypothetical protein
LEFKKTRLENHEMFLSQEAVKSLRDHFGNLLALVNKEIKNEVRSVIVKMQIIDNVNVCSVGKTSSKGFFVPCYNIIPAAADYVAHDVFPELYEVFLQFRILNPRSKTLFFRFNSKRDTFEIFRSGTFCLTTRLDY